MRNSHKTDKIRATGDDWYDPGIERVDGQFVQFKNKFKSHPHALGQTYKGHLWQSLKRSAKSFALSLEYLIHAIFPFWFKDLDMSPEQQRDAAGIIGAEVFELNSDSSSDIELEIDTNISGEYRNYRHRNSTDSFQTIDF